MQHPFFELTFPQTRTMRIFIPVLLTSVLLVTIIRCAPRTASSVRNDVTYTKNIQPLIQMHCSPCHIPPKGFKQAFNTYPLAKEWVDSMIVRIHLEPGQPGFMPFKRQKLSDSTIRVFEEWRAGGLKE
jgi:hypothetical protein